VAGGAPKIDETEIGETLMTEKKEPLTFTFTIELKEKVGTYDYNNLLKVNFTESVPAGNAPVPYIKKRIAEELNRQEAVMKSHAALEKPAPVTDPLLETPPF
jgi:hypothetical protein